MQFSGKVVKIVPTDGDDKVRLAVNDNPNNLLIVDVDQDLLSGSNLSEGQQVTETARGLSSNVAKSDNLAITSDDDSSTNQDSEIDVDVEPDDNIHTITEVSPNISNNEPIAYHTDIT
ncbi:hypothetical protein GQS40_08575|uniref:Uncharacterized protein n=1 Tax=Leuconostoc lactis TaxID=1246 RepID=A0A6L7A752_LEULA|nr:hypothetical protein [Leuconostoc lactis]